jgi:integrase
MKLKKINGTYVVFFKDAEGKTHQRSTRQTDKAKAMEVVKEARIEELERAAIAQSLTHETVGVLLTGRKVTVKSAIEQWEKWRDTLGRSENSTLSFSVFIKAWAKEQGVAGQPVMSLTEGQISDYVNPDTKIKRSTRECRLSALRSFVGFCVAKGYLRGNPSQLVRVNHKKMTHAMKTSKVRKAFSYAEYQQLIKYLREFLVTPRPDNVAEVHWPSKDWAKFWLCAIPLSYWLGLRLGDIAQLEWDCFEEGTIEVWTEKRDKKVKLPLNDPMIGSPELEEVIHNLLPEHDRYVFPFQAAIQMDPTGRHLLSTNFKRWVERAGLGDTGKTFHCLRHSFVTRLYRSGKTIEDIAELVAHRNTATTEHYNGG